MQLFTSEDVDGQKGWAGKQSDELGNNDEMVISPFLKRPRSIGFAGLVKHSAGWEDATRHLPWQPTHPFSTAPGPMLPTPQLGRLP